jgi:hypothetical protein
MVIPRTSGKNNNAQTYDREAKAMAGRSHEPYYFSTRWNTGVPNIPLFHCSIIPVVPVQLSLNVPIITFEP